MADQHTSFLPPPQAVTIARPPAPQPVTATRGEDVHAFYRRWRPVSPLLELVSDQTPIPMLLVTRHNDAVTLLTDPRTRQFETELLALRGVEHGPLFAFFDNVMLASNPPVHAARRAPLSRAFAFKLMDAWRPHIRRLAHDLISQSMEDGLVAFNAKVASQIPPRIVASVLGLDPGDVDHFLALVRVCSRGLSNFPAEDLPAIDAAMAELTAYVADQMAKRRAKPATDVLTAYVATVDATNALSEAEKLAQLAGVILAGSDTTRTGITAMMSELLKRPEQWALVCADPAAHAANAVLETLRFHPPVGSIPRITLQDIEVGDRIAPAGRVVSLSVISALRDPDVISDPDEFDVTRTDIPRWLLSFGGGAHRCLGEALARAEMEETLIAAAERLPRAALVGEPPVMRGATGIRDIGELTLRVR